MSRSFLARLAPCGLLCLLVACNSSTQALTTKDILVDTAKQTQATETQTPAAEEQSESLQSANIKRQPSTVARKGTYIRALVNGDPITNSDVQRRSKFRQVRRAGGGEQAALEEMVDEKLKLQEAKRRGVLATDAMVDSAFANFARNNRATPSQISAQLNGMGIGVDHFKEFIRTQISWTRTLGARIRSENRQEGPGRAIFELRQSGAEKPQTTEYMLQQIIFVVPRDKRDSMLKPRRQEALNFKQRFTGCDDAIELAKTLRDVTVKPPTRIMQPELPSIWKDEVTAAVAGQTTNPKETENGIELIGICSARTISDDRVVQVVSEAKSFEQLEESGSQEDAEFLAELRRKASIVYK